MYLDSLILKNPNLAAETVRACFRSLHFCTTQGSNDITHIKHETTFENPRVSVIFDAIHSYEEYLMAKMQRIKIFYEIMLTVGCFEAWKVTKKILQSFNEIETITKDIKLKWDIPDIISRAISKKNASVLLYFVQKKLKLP